MGRAIEEALVDAGLAQHLCRLFFRRRQGNDLRRRRSGGQSAGGDGSRNAGGTAAAHCCLDRGVTSGCSEERASAALVRVGLAGHAPGACRSSSSMSKRPLQQVSTLGNAPGLPGAVPSSSGSSCKPRLHGAVAFPRFGLGGWPSCNKRAAAPKRLPGPSCSQSLNRRSWRQHHRVLGCSRASASFFEWPAGPAAGGRRPSLRRPAANAGAASGAWQRIAVRSQAAASRWAAGHERRRLGQRPSRRPGPGGARSRA